VYAAHSRALAANPIRVDGVRHRLGQVQRRQRQHNQHRDAAVEQADPGQVSLKRS
jgi:hypothetical protein